MKVCHMTSAHPQEDIRIFHKECVSLAKAGYETYLVSCGSSYKKNEVELIGIGEPEKSRFGRMAKTARRVFEAAIEIDSDIYHIHDPELLPYGLRIKKLGKKVIFDSHEDVPAQIMDKTWIMKPLRKIVSSLYKKYETYVVSQLDAVVTATSHIGKKFEPRSRITVVVNNYPRLDDIVFHKTPFRERDQVVCYAGRIDDLRGESIMKEAMSNVEGKLILAGDHSKIESGNIKYIGRQNRDGINELYGRAVLGLCILKPIENYYYSKPIKIYEYMAAGIPYICSDFPEWRKIVEESDAGMCVDPSDIKEISRMISCLMNDRDKGESMGKKGREYIEKKANWDIEEEKLLDLYRLVLSIN